MPPEPCTSTTAGTFRPGRSGKGSRSSPAISAGLAGGLPAGEEVPRPRGCVVASGTASIRPGEFCCARAASGARASNAASARPPRRPMMMAWWRPSILVARPGRLLALAHG